ncbi:MAG: M15 family metallopeptidase [Solobacterium sp.]|nr:M15 family metallopeptidase [Solobacterium sp.]
MENKYRFKFILIIILAILNLLGLAYLHFNPFQPAPKPQESEAPVESVPAESPVPEETEPAESTQPVEAVVIPSVMQWVHDRAADRPQHEPEPEPEPEPSAPAVWYDSWADDSYQRLISRQRPVDASYEPADLVKTSAYSDYPEYLRQDAAWYLEEMFKAAEADGVKLLLIDGYRSYTEQRSLYNTYVQRYSSSTIATMDCWPGASEHQLGLAVDLGDRLRSCNLRTCFDSTTVSSWLREHAWEYGWIERYPYGKTDITGIAYSPWHYRFVGTDLAKELHDSGLTMEEYFAE